MKNLNTYLLLFVIVATCLSCSDDDNRIETPVVTGGMVSIIDSYANFNGENQSFYATNKSTDGERPFNALTTDWTFETWVKIEEGTNLTEEPLTSSIIMEQRYVFSLYATPANESKPEADVEEEVIDYNQPGGIGTNLIKVKADYELKYSKLANNSTDVELESMSTYDNENIVLSYGKWVHIAITRSSSDNTARFFVNGQLVSSGTDDVWISKSSVSAVNWSGTYRGGYYGFAKCGLRKVRVSNVSRYNEDFIPDLGADFEEDDETLFLLNLIEEEMIDPLDDTPEMDVKGTYPYSVSLRQNNWDSESKMIYK